MKLRKKKKRKQDGYCTSQNVQQTAVIFAKQQVFLRWNSSTLFGFFFFFNKIGLKTENLYFNAQITFLVAATIFKAQNMKFYKERKKKIPTEPNFLWNISSRDWLAQVTLKVTEVPPELQSDSNSYHEGAIQCRFLFYETSFNLCLNPQITNSVIPTRFYKRLFRLTTARKIFSAMQRLHNVFGLRNNALATKWRCLFFLRVHVVIILFFFSLFHSPQTRHDDYSHSAP